MKINTEIEINSVKDLGKLKILVEVNNLGKPNFSELGRKLGIDRRTVKKYYEGNIQKERKQKKSKIDDYYDTIRSLLSAENKQIFYYKSHLYRYLVREHGLQCSRSNFNYFILKNNEFTEYFKSKSKKDAIKSETPFGKQAQFDWKEKLKFSFKDGSKMILNVGSLVLSASRFKVWTIYPSTSQNHLFDFLANAFETIGGVPEEILIDNASTMMDQARTEGSQGKINNKFKQLADDFGFKVVPCIRARPNTKAKVENPMRIIDEIMNYNGIVENLEELHKKMSIITNEANSRMCQATGLPPILVFNKEKEHLLPLPHDKVCSFYKNTTTSAKVNTNALFKYKQNMYSVPPELIGKIIVVEVTENNLYVYYNKTLVTIHNISNKKVNYHTDHHIDLLGITFKGQDEETVSEYANKHFKELEKFNEQLSEVM
ncbi:IS21 family transposase [uncultured Clostridium sp.]|uniref:IS21 family transposase n=1 Tax=uncultured Clostridium sp. TaxID=59620 RepID=UPI00280AA1F0|nr:IS21 family transposase [uncultured Clostridium sp.]